MTAQPTRFATSRERDVRGYFAQQPSSRPESTSLVLVLDASVHLRVAITICPNGTGAVAVRPFAEPGLLGAAGRGRLVLLARAAGCAEHDHGKQESQHGGPGESVAVSSQA